MLKTFALEYDFCLNAARFKFGKQTVKICLTQLPQSAGATTEGFTYLSSDLVANEKTIFDLDNANHVCVLDLVLSLGTWLLQANVFLLLELIWSSHELLLRAGRLLLLPALARHLVLVIG